VDRGKDLKTGCRVFLFEDDDYEHFYPLAYSRPVFTLQSGLYPLWQKWHYLSNELDIRFLCRGEIANFTREQSGIACNRISFEDCERAIFINGRVLPDRDMIKMLLDEIESGLYLTHGNLSAAIVTADSPRAKDLERMKYWGYGHFKSIVNGLGKHEVECTWLDYIWDFIAINPEQIKNDVQAFQNRLKGHNKSLDDLTNVGCLLYSPGNVYVAPNARIDGQTVLDARGGPIVIDEDAVVYSLTRIEGPCYVGKGTQIVGAKVREGCSFGPNCRVGGEVEESIFQGYSNKYHEGFIGHAFLGEWVNLGALTTNSDLKNNYGNIKVDIGIGLTDTAMMKVGSFIGDHVKTGIGMLLNTGISIGFGSNIFGGGLITDKNLPPFVWGGRDGYSEYRLDKALETAKVAMSRRGRELTPATAATFKHIFEITQEARENFISK
jgi:UDP-N-acetylglucosamine diphosphorylase/glucosamine-1-phosphate N-acetyltransferase